MIFKQLQASLIGSSKRLSGGRRFYGSACLFVCKRPLVACGAKLLKCISLFMSTTSFTTFAFFIGEGEGGLQACSPCNQGKLEEETTGFTKEMTGSMRMAFLIRKMGQANGRLYETYMILVLLRCLPFAWIFAFCHLVAFFVVYPWCFLLLTTVVLKIMWLERLLNLCSGGSKQRQSVKGRFGRSQLKAGGFTFSPFSESESEFLLESRRQLAKCWFSARALWSQAAWFTKNTEAARVSRGGWDSSRLWRGTRCAQGYWPYSRCLVLYHCLHRCWEIHGRYSCCNHLSVSCGSWLPRICTSNALRTSLGRLIRQYAELETVKGDLLHLREMWHAAGSMTK